MTGNRKILKLSAVLASLSPSSFQLELKKSSRGAVAVISGVMSVGEYTENSVELLSHSGRMHILGEALGISVMSGRVIEIYGRITEVQLNYGKS